MGLNAFFVYTVCIGFGFSYANALVLVFFEGLVFIILTVYRLAQKDIQLVAIGGTHGYPCGNRLIYRASRLAKCGNRG